MGIHEALEEAGLNESETQVYVELLKAGPSKVSRIKERTGIHRTTIYDILESLLQKGLVSYTIKDNAKHFRAAHPSRLAELVREKEEKITEAIPELAKLANLAKEEIRVEVYTGREGFKFILNDVLKTGRDLAGFGIDERDFVSRFPVLMEQFFMKEEDAGIHERLLTSEKAGFLFDKKTTHYRFLPEEYFSPAPTMVYGNKVCIIIWEPLTVILIENESLAESYRKSFELLWKIAKKNPGHAEKGNRKEKKKGEAKEDKSKRRATASPE